MLFLIKKNINIKSKKLKETKILKLIIFLKINKEKKVTASHLAIAGGLEATPFLLFFFFF
jgi:hypothetical protein